MFTKGLSDCPWYVYVLAGCLSLFLGKSVTKVATDMMKSIEVESDSVTPETIKASDSTGPSI